MTRYEWMDRAVCAPQGAAWLRKKTVDQIDDCLDCPVRLPCLLYAVDVQATHVVYGGLKLPHQPLTPTRRNPWEPDSSAPPSSQPGPA